MKIKELLILGLGFVFLGSNWHPCFAQRDFLNLPITPLKTSRPEVEKVADLVADHVQFSDYIIKSGRLRVKYSKKPCIWSGWKVNAGTVLEFDFYPKESRSKGEMKNSISGLPVFIDDVFSEYVSDSRKGIQYVFSPDGSLDFVRRTPATTDNHLRCKGFEAYSVAADTYGIFEHFDITDIDSWDISQLGGLFVELKKSPKKRGTLFIYTPQTTKDRKKLNMLLEHIKKYAYEIQKVSRSRLTVAEGGFRDDWEIDAVIQFNDDAPPIPRPKYPSNR